MSASQEGLCSMQLVPLLITWLAEFMSEACTLNFKCLRLKLTNQLPVFRVM